MNQEQAGGGVGEDDKWVQTSDRHQGEETNDLQAWAGSAEEVVFSRVLHWWKSL